MLYGDERDDEPVIIIGGDESVSRIARGSGASVKSFESIDEFERWRESKDRSMATVRAEVVEALREIGTAFDELPGKLQPVFGFFARCHIVPAVSDLERVSPSRRSLYRIWASELHETPSRFLRRVRLLHAQRLIESGASNKEAALQAGFGSVDRMRRLLASRRGERS